MVEPSTESPAAGAKGVERPRRWDEPLGERPLSEREIERIRSTPPFSRADPAAFTKAVPLDGILRYDTRIVRCLPGDVICRQGDYGTSAFFVLSGNVRIVLEGAGADLGDEITGSVSHRRRGLVSALSQLWRNARVPEARDPDSVSGDRSVSTLGLTIEDVPRVLDRHRTVRLGAGELFGESSALSRVPRTATVFAESEAELLEIKWQGLRDLCRRAPAIKEHVDSLYRENALRAQLRMTPIFAHLGEEDVQEIAAETVFESYGDREWTASYRRLAEKGTADLLRGEPIIAEEGHYPNGLVLIRSGFVRVSRRFGNGHRTLRYLGRGQTFGLEELVANWRGQGDPIPYQSSLRAIGYVDVLWVPTLVLEQRVFPALSDEQLPAPPRPARSGGVRALARETKLHTQHLEELVERRTINGSATMMIDLDRCTRCDDCVRACASTHDGNPRFIRHGEQVGRWMIANACMHCVDPVCMIGCPTGAIHRASLEGQVAINDATCIGCETCANNCPYDNIRMVRARDPGGAFLLDRETRAPILKATKCDLCVDQRTGPACQNACPHDALERVDMLDVERLQALLDR